MRSPSCSACSEAELLPPLEGSASRRSVAERGQERRRGQLDARSPDLGGGSDGVVVVHLTGRERDEGMGAGGNGRDGGGQGGDP